MCKSITFFLFIAKVVFHIMNIPEFIDLPVGGHSNYFDSLLAIRNKAAINIHIQSLNICFYFTWIHLFTRSRIVG